MKKPESPPPQKKRKSKENNCCAQEYGENQMRLINSAERNASFLELRSSPFSSRSLIFLGGTLNFRPFCGCAHVRGGY